MRSAVYFWAKTFEATALKSGYVLGSRVSARLLIYLYYKPIDLYMQYPKKHLLGCYTSIRKSRIIFNKINP